ncbi:hypothetical protein [Tenacibaculum sp.]|uniref:hypothetical protein n=1 Tax=Tenacibaculum sp. TaxID=1906242 RepID=UPI003AA8F10F
MNFGKHCDLCENQKTNFYNGITCSLTGLKESFNIVCPDIKLEEKLEKKLDIVNINVEINRQKKSSVYFFFYVSIIIGFFLIIGGVLISKSTVVSVYATYITFGVISLGVSFLGIGYEKLNRFRDKEKKDNIEKNKIDKLLSLYKINYEPIITFGEKRHGVQEITINIQVKNGDIKSYVNIYKKNEMYNS